MNDIIKEITVEFFEVYRFGERRMFISRIKTNELVTEIETLIEEDRLAAFLIHLEKQNARIIQGIAKFDLNGRND